MRAGLVEGITALNRALGASGGDRSALRDRALAWRGYLAFFAGDAELAHHDPSEALALAEELGDRSRAEGTRPSVTQVPGSETRQVTFVPL